MDRPAIEGGSNLGLLLRSSFLLLLSQISPVGGDRQHPDCSHPFFPKGGGGEEMKKFSLSPFLFFITLIIVSFFFFLAAQGKILENEMKLGGRGGEKGKERRQAGRLMPRSCQTGKRTFIFQGKQEK